MSNLANPLMRKIKSNDLLDKLSYISNKLMDEVRTEFEGLSKEQLHWNPDKTSWSIAQCFVHLNAFHTFYVPAFEERILNSRFQSPEEMFQSSPLGNSTYIKVKLGKLKNVKRKLKSPKDYNPLINKNLDTENVVDKFLDFQSQLIQAIDGARNINIRKTKMSFTKRPIVKLRVGDALQYIVYHCERHVEQAKRIKAHRKFPVN
ncbi:MAG: DinB family protein [Crocinitomicaceae bacterium]